MSRSKVRKAIIPAAGLGTRFLPATKAAPKEMLPVVDKPVIQYVVEEAVASGVETIIFITGRGKNAIENHFDRAVELEEVLQKRGEDSRLEELRRISELAEIVYIRQKEPKGLGHAVWCARSVIGQEPFAVLLGDDIIDPQGSKPCLAQIMDVQEERGGMAVAVQEVPKDQVNRYGIIGGKALTQRLWKVNELVEKPSPQESPSQLAVIGRYILPPEIFRILEETQPGVAGEIQLTDALVRLMAKEPLFALAFFGRRFDTGDKLGFLQAAIAFALDREDLGPSLRKWLQDYLK